MRCTWSNDPHYVLRPVRENWVSRYDYHSPSCHYILEVGDDILIQEQSYQCGGAGCISKVLFYIYISYLYIASFFPIYHVYTTFFLFGLIPTHFRLVHMLLASM